MADTTTKQRKVAEHGLLTVNGGETNKMEEAVAITYYLLANPKDVFTYESKATDPGIRMRDLFGAKTICTNTTSQIRQQGGDEAEQMTAVRERFGNMDDGVWLENVERGGLSIDVAVLARVYCDYATAQGKPKDYEEIVKKLTEDKALKSKIHDSFRAEYKAAKGKTVVSKDDALALA